MSPRTGHPRGQDRLAAFALSLLLGACATYNAPRYSTSADNDLALKAFAPAKVDVGPFSSGADFGSGCRGGSFIEMPDGLTPEEYVRRALIEEIKLAGLYEAAAPQVTLTGRLETMEFSSHRGVTGGTWDLGLTLTSSTGTFLTATERYEFPVGFVGAVACQQVANGLPAAVQNLIAKVVHSPDFPTLLAWPTVQREVAPGGVEPAEGEEPERPPAA